MNTCFVPSLEHLSSVKVVTSLLNDTDIILEWNPGEENYYRNKFKITENISKLIPGGILKTKLENFVVPIFSEIEKWAYTCEQSWVSLKRNKLPLIDAIRQCWLSDGSIDREKSAKIWIKKNDASPLDRFVSACVYCLFDDVVNMWEMLSGIEKAFLRHRDFTVIAQTDYIVRRWIEWLDSSTNKDWESCAAWILEIPMWKSNVYILKRVLQTLSPAERSKYLLNALLEKEVNSDVMKFGLQIMSRDEREVILRESPLEVLKCALAWPLRCIFVDIADELWLYITADIFCSILKTILNEIKNEERDYRELLVILRRFWEQSPGHCKRAAEGSDIARPLTFVLKYDFSKPFRRRGFLNCFKPVYDYLAPVPIMTLAEFMRREIPYRY